MASSYTNARTMVTSSTSLTSPMTVTSFGPVGTPLDIRESGENILDIFCDGYPDSDKSVILPNFFDSKITELMEPIENLTRKQEDQFRGRMINQIGEGHELVVFNMFGLLIRQFDLLDPLLIMRSFEMDTKNQMDLKKNALLSLLPNINFKSINTQAENDFVILVKNRGIVFVEVKGSTKDNNVRSAEKQLHNVNGIVQRIMKAMTKDDKRIIPTVKLIIIPDCAKETPADATQLGSYFIFKDACDRFNEKWLDIIDMLDQTKSAKKFEPMEFKKLCQILVGVWSAKVVSGMDLGLRNYELKQDEREFAYVKQLEETDRKIDTADIRDENQFKSADDKLNPFTKIVRTKESDIFRSCSDVRLCYLTPDQKQLFSNCKQAVIRGSAGCGKSLLILFKVLELAKEPTHPISQILIPEEKKVLILATFPHTIRIVNVLRSSNISVDIIEQFPPALPYSSKFFVMELERFFNKDAYLQHNMSGYHLFVDDLQKLSSADSSFLSPEGRYEIGEFIDKTYHTCVQCDCYLWLMLDELQGANCTQFSFLFSKLLHSFDIPVWELGHVMRNSYDIAQLNNETRGEIEREAREMTQNFPSTRLGHKITSHTPVWHKLQPEVDKEYILPFLISRLHKELEAVTKPPFSLPLSSVAIIFQSDSYFHEGYDHYKSYIVSFLVDEFGTTPQTIAEQLTSNNTTDIVMDVEDNITSYESPVVVCIYTDDNRPSLLSWYRIGTRARVSFTIIDASPGIPCLYDNTDMVLWIPDSSGNFVKCN